MRQTPAAAALRQILNRNFNLATAVNFCVMIAYYQILVVSAPLAQERFGASLSVAGLTAGIMVIACLLGRFVTGNLISALGARRIVIGGCLLYAAAAAGSFYADSLFELFVQRFTAGLSMGIIGTATGTIMAWSVPPAVQGLGVSIFSLSTALALALGPFFGIAIAHGWGFEVLATVILGLSLLALALCLPLQAPPALKAAHISLFKLSNYIDVRVLKLSVVVMLVPMGYGCLTAYLSSFAAERDLGAAVSLFFLMSGLSTILTRPLCGRLFDLYGENLVLYPAILLSALALLLVSLAHSVWLIIIAGMVQGIGFGNFTSAGQALALKLVRKYRFAQATSTYFIFFDLGIGAAPYLFGFAAAAWGFGLMYLLLSAVVLAALGLYYFIHGRAHPLKRSLKRGPVPRG